MQNKFDLIVIGAGSGGIAAANRAAEYGAKVALIEKNLLGGTCVNVGCVPKKIMWTASQRLLQIKEAKGLGIDSLKPVLQWQTLVKNRQSYIEKLHKGYANRLQNNKVTLIQGEGSFKDHNTVMVNSQTYQAPHILISTGAQSKWPNLPGHEFGIDSEGFFALKSLPKRIAVVGAGYIAVELAGMLNAFGSEVSLVFRQENVLRDFDPSLNEQLISTYEQHGMNLLRNHTPQRLLKTNDGLILECENNKQVPQVDTVIWAIGRTPQLSSLQLEKVCVNLDKAGRIQVDEYQNTNIKGIYAVGDVASSWQLTPTAIKAGRKLSDRLFNAQAQAKVDYSLIPTVIFSHPPIATLGMSEQDAKKTYKNDLKIYQSQFTPMIAAFDEHPSPCFIKLITIASSGKIIGCHMIGEMVDEILQGFAVAIKMGATKSDFDETIAIHPTIAEELVTMR